MQFRTTKANLITILGDAAAGRYQVVDHQVQVVDSTEILGNSRRVQVFYGEGDFPKGKAALTGPTQHEAVYRVELAVSAATTVDLAVLNNPASTDGQRQTALAAFDSSAKLADDSIDELFDIVYQVLMDGRNVDLGETGPPYKVSNRWVDGFRKEAPVPQGEYVELTASVQFSCQLIEEVTGETGTPAVSPAFDVVDDIIGDDNEKTGSLT